MWLMSDSGLSAATAGKLPVGREGASRRRQRRPNMCRIMVSIQCSESWSVYSPMFRVMVSIQSYLHSHDQYTVLCSESWSVYSLIFTVMVSIPSYVHSHGQYTVLSSQSWSVYPPMFTVMVSIQSYVHSHGQNTLLCSQSFMSYVTGSCWGVPCSCWRSLTLPPSVC